MTATAASADAAITYSPAISFVTARAGETQQVSILVQNQTRLDARIDVAILDMQAGDGVTTTAFDYVPVGEARRGAGAWLQTSTRTMQVRAGTEQRLELTLRVPEDAGAGGHYAAVELLASDPRPVRGEVVIDYATHVPVLVTVDGEARRALDVTAAPDRRWRLDGGTARWTVTLHNRGDVHEIISGRLRVDGLLAGADAVPLSAGILLPGEQRRQHVDVDLRAAPDVLRATAEVQLEDAADATGTAARVVVLPWWLLVLVGCALAVITWRVRAR